MATLTLDFGITKGRCKALVQSLSARTASRISLDKMPRSISGGCIEGSHPSAGAGCDTATCTLHQWQAGLERLLGGSQFVHT